MAMDPFAIALPDAMSEVHAMVLLQVTLTSGWRMLHKMLDKLAPPQLQPDGDQPRLTAASQAHFTPEIQSVCCCR